MHKCDLFTGEQQVCRGNSIHSMTTLLQLKDEARATREREQLFRHDVLAWIPPFASLSAPTLSTTTSTNASPHMSFWR